MPIFEYVCQGCENHFEAIVQGSQTPECPACQSKKLEKQLSVFAVSSNGAAASREPIGGCGSCGDPRGPGSCSLN